MAVSDLVLQGVNLMLLGMGIVFSFLAILVVTLNGMSKLAAALYQPGTPTPSATASTSEVGDSELIAVISAAINRYRSKK
ncbi:MAG: OadG family protein [Gammaproteobacteria bacterium]|jgi:oxaloacetate decarboxylase (Na+ extruding) subunit gamma